MKLTDHRWSADHILGISVPEFSRDNKNRLFQHKAVPLLHASDKGEKRYSSYSLLTSSVIGGEWSALRPGRALPPRKGPAVLIVWEAGWAPELVWTQRLEAKCFASAGDRIPVVQSVVRHYSDWATQAAYCLNIRKCILPLNVTEFISRRSIQMRSQIMVLEATRL
jgi:hypothetical protein